MAPQCVSHAPNNRLGTNRFVYVNKQCSMPERICMQMSDLPVSFTTKRTFLASDVNMWLGRGVGSRKKRSVYEGVNMSVNNQNITTKAIIFALKISTMQVNSEFLLGNSTYLNHKNKLLENEPNLRADP